MPSLCGSFQFISRLWNLRKFRISHHIRRTLQRQCHSYIQYGSLASYLFGVSQAKKGFNLIIASKQLTFNIVDHSSCIMFDSKLLGNVRLWLCIVIILLVVFIILHHQRCICPLNNKRDIMFYYVLCQLLITNNSNNLVQAASWVVALSHRCQKLGKRRKVTHKKSQQSGQNYFCFCQKCKFIIHVGVSSL